MYLVKYKDGKTFVPCKNISWLINDTYVCTVSHGEDSAVETKEILADATEIFPIEVPVFAQFLVESQGYGDSNWSEGGRVVMDSLKKRVTESWFFYKGGLFTDIVHMGDGYFTQFQFSRDILSKKGIRMISDPVIPMGRILIEPLTPTRVKRGRKNIFSKQHLSILEFIDKHGPATTFIISESLGIPISSVAGRVSELTRAGKLKCVSVDCSTGIKRSVWGDENHKSWL